MKFVAESMQQKFMFADHTWRPVIGFLGALTPFGPHFVVSEPDTLVCVRIYIHIQFWNYTEHPSHISTQQATKRL